MTEMEKDIVDEVQKRKLIWFGHTNRMDETGWPRKLLEWVPEEKCEGGRPRQGWRDEVKEAMEARDFADEVCCRRENWRLGPEKRRQL
jgi:hypothetical protein